MTTRLSILLGLALAVGCASEGVGDGAGAVTVTTDCTLEGFGTLPAGDDFEGSAVGLPDGFAEGTWVHLGPETEVPDDEDDDDDDDDDDECRGERRGHRMHRGRGHRHHRGEGRGHCRCDDDDDDDTPATTRDRFEGEVESVTCFINGSRVGTAEGNGTWNGDPGYTFELGVVDSGVSNDEYTFTVYDSSGGVVYSVNGFPDSGDLTVVDY